MCSLTWPPYHTCFRQGWKVTDQEASKLLFTFQKCHHQHIIPKPSSLTYIFEEELNGQSSKIRLLKRGYDTTEDKLLIFQASQRGVLSWMSRCSCSNMTLRIQDSICQELKLQPWGNGSGGNNLSSQGGNFSLGHGKHNRQWLEVYCDRAAVLNFIKLYMQNFRYEYWYRKLPFWGL